MSEAINDGGNAFPCDPFIASRPGTEAVAKRMAEGMSLRDHFAGQALQGLCANPGGPYQASPMRGWDIVNCTPDDIAGCAYGLADAMIRARNGGAA